MMMVMVMMVMMVMVEMVIVVVGAIMGGTWKQEIVAVIQPSEEMRPHQLLLLWLAAHDLLHVEEEHKRKVVKLGVGRQGDLLASVPMEST